jgi:hypothetical protein
MFTTSLSQEIENVILVMVTRVYDGSFAGSYPRKRGRSAGGVHVEIWGRHTSIYENVAADRLNH